MIATITHLTGRRRGQRETFPHETITAGRATDNLLCFGDGERRVSSHHAQITRHGETFLIRDLGSTNGTMINGRRVIISELNCDDLIEFGAGGPLVRFGVEQATNNGHRAISSPGDLQTTNDDKTNEDLSRKPDRQSRVTRAIRRSLRKSKNNVRLTVAIVLSMLFGAGFGLWMASRFASPDSLVSGFASIAERNRAAVVFIQAEYEYVDAAGNITGLETRTGSGFVVSESGFVVTNRHLVRDWEYNQPPPGITGRVKKISVVFADKTRAEAVPATVAHLSQGTELDVAILKIQPPPDLTTIYDVEPNLSRVSQGDAVATLGYPFGFQLLPNEERIGPTLSTGVVSRVGQDVLLTLHSYHGSSGAPVFNRRGEVIAIVTSNPLEAQDLTICTPIAAAVELIKDELSYKDQSTFRKEPNNVSDINRR